MPLGGRAAARTSGCAAGEVARLDELRLSALLDRIDTDLALGRHAEVVGELEELIVAQPLRERPRGHLMLALYRAGRQAEALEVYRTTGEVLVEELGIEPGSALQSLQASILNHDQVLGGPSSQFPGERRFFGRFSDAVRALVEARIWGGLHFRNADVQGA